MKIIVTGSSGYLGGSFINAFKGKYDFIKFSLLASKIEDLDFSNVDVILHCAALVHQKTEHDYEEYYDINVVYPVAMARKAKESDAKQFVFISTIAVYGEEMELIDENTACNPKTHYGKSKLEAERQLQELDDENFIVSIVRPPLVYGRDAPGNMASLINLVKKVRFLPCGKIDNKRSFIYIENLLHFIDAVIEKRKSGIFLVSDNDPVSTTKLIELIAKELDKKVYLIPMPLFERILKLIKPLLHKKLFGSLEIDNRITKKKLGFTSIYTIEEGLKLLMQRELL